MRVHLEVLVTKTTSARFADCIPILGTPQGRCWSENDERDRAREVCMHGIMRVHARGAGKEPLNPLLVRSRHLPG